MLDRFYFLTFVLYVLINRATCNEPAPTPDELVAQMGSEIADLEKQLQRANESLTKKQSEMLDEITNTKKLLVEKSKDDVKTLNEEMAVKFDKVETYLDEKKQTILNDVDKYASNKIGKLYTTYYNWLEKQTDKWMTGDTWDTKHQWRIIKLNQIESKLKNTHKDLLDKYILLKAKYEKAVQGELTEEEKAEKVAKMKELEDDLYVLSRHLQAVQFHQEEQLRTDGQSGIKQIRTGKVGSENYHSNTHTGGSFSSIHDHSNNIRTVGMGEFIGIINGVQFRTRHNDYRLFQPATNDKTYHKVEDVKFPELPEVFNDMTVDEQIVEMRAWFKAWANQDYSVRDYRKHFKPVLVYLEGAWTTNKGDKLDEPFDSDRHHLDAKTWLELQDKVRFTSYTGAKSLLENLAHLPTKIMRFTKDRTPVFAQWNYRIACHPISQDVPTSYLEPRYDEASQRRNRRDDEQYVNSRSARFDIEGIDIEGKRDRGALEYSFLDSLMEEIPGKDNYDSKIESTGFDAPDDKLYSANPKKKDTLLNSAYYHRSYIQKSKNGLLQETLHRTFSDRLYVAETTSERVAYTSYNNTAGQTVNTRVSFAIPVEIIYLTPLHSWNPYNIAYVPKSATGSGTQSSPFSSASSKVYYYTPDEFFSGGEVATNAADTTKPGATYVNSPSGVKAVRASGTRIFFPEIDGIEKKIRQRYPIMPVHGEGSPLWKKLNALEDALNFDPEDGGDLGGNPNYKTGNSHSSQPGATGHYHEVSISEEDLRSMREDGKTIVVETENAAGHSHQIEVAYNDETNQFYIKTCVNDEQSDEPSNGLVCRDKHTNTISIA